MAMVRSQPPDVSTREAAIANAVGLRICHEDLDDLSTFSGLSKEDCFRRLQSYSPREMADRWNAAPPQNPDEIIAFYQAADLYVWELMAWHAGADRQRYRAILELVAKDFTPDAGFKRVLDFGCGVGTDSLFLASRGYTVTLMDVDGPAFRFARHRFGRRGLEATFITSSSAVPQLDGLYDIVICFDVFEHLPDPATAAQNLVRSLRPGGLLVQVAAFHDWGQYPHHLAANIVRFHSAKWYIWLSGLGLRPIDEAIYRKVSGPGAWLRRWRFNFWRFTGIWVSWIDPREKGRGS
jgi:SAM-dependent methyltransferase